MTYGRQQKTAVSISSAIRYSIRSRRRSISIKMILKHYHSYIVKLCLTNGFNEAEQFITYVDEYMLRQLEIKLIEAILKFKIN